MTITNEELLTYIDEVHRNRKHLLGNPSKARTKEGMDRFKTFEMMSNILDITKEEQMLHLVTKHFVDLVLMVKGEHPMSFDLDYLEELLCDLHNYLDFIFVSLSKQQGERKDLG